MIIFVLRFKIVENGSLEGFNYNKIKPFDKNYTFIDVLFLKYFYNSIQRKTETIRKYLSRVGTRYLQY